MRINRPAIGILFVLIGMTAISVNDVLIKQLSGNYPLHQIVLSRSVIGLALTLFMVRLEGGLTILRTRQPLLHAGRGLLVVIANMSFFVALAVAPLADVTALFFAAPLFITLLSIPILGERVGPMRLIAVVTGFAGVVVMQRPWEGSALAAADRIVLLLPVLSALAYALAQILTRKLGASAKASALSVYIQGMFVIVSLGFFLVAGDGRFAQATTNPSLVFLFRPWIWPLAGDWWLLIALGVNVAIISYALSQAYRMADAATVAPFEYIGLPLAVFWGWLIWAEIPQWQVWMGMALIVGSGLVVFLRERAKRRTAARSGIRPRN